MPLLNLLTTAKMIIPVALLLVTAIGGQALIIKGYRSELAVKDSEIGNLESTVVALNTAIAVTEQIRKGDIINLKELNSELSAARETTRRLSGTLDAKRLDRLARAKPTLMQGKVNRASAHMVWDLMEAANGG